MKLVAAEKRNDDNIISAAVACGREDAERQRSRRPLRESHTGGSSAAADQRDASDTDA